MFGFGALGLRARFARKLPLGVFWMNTGSTAVMEIAAEAGPDAIVIDAQHGLWDRTTLEHAVGLVSNRVPVLVRTADASAISISQALDTGAEGVIVPLIETDTQAAAVVAAARFPPHGSRSGGGVGARGSDIGR
jgi:2-keto-3-deoxy-L-rhamnonate aldolase RhmA